jgi:hypothetical protein
MKLALVGAAMSLFASAALAEGAATKAAKPETAKPEAAAPAPTVSAADMKEIHACRTMSAGMRSGTKACATLAKTYPDLLDTSKPLPYVQVATDTAEPPPKPPAKKGS